MTAVAGATPLSTLLSKAFHQLDQDRDRQLDRAEFAAFYEVLRPGIATDKEGQPTVSQDQQFQRMDHDGNGRVSHDEMQSTGVLMPAELCDDSLAAMIDYLKRSDTVASSAAAALLSVDKDPTHRE